MCIRDSLADENNSLWSQVLYGITGGDGEIVTVALSQVGNVGGEPYWSWYGSVSYTHLDVYKRQHLRQLCRGEKAGARAEAVHPVRHRQRRRDLWIGADDGPL